MEPPASLSAPDVRDEQVKALCALGALGTLRALAAISVEDMPTRCVRGRYVAGVVDGRQAPGFDAECTGAEAAEAAETLVAIKAMVNNWRRANVPLPDAAPSPAARRLGSDPQGRASHPLAAWPAFRAERSLVHTLGVVHPCRRYAQATRTSPACQALLAICGNARRRAGAEFRDHALRLRDDAPRPAAPAIPAAASATPARLPRRLGRRRLLRRMAGCAPRRVRRAGLVGLRQRRGRRAAQHPLVLGRLAPAHPLFR